jgi:predicted nuclease of predicted toxin-antitoxin system
VRRFLIDENLPRSLASYLRNAGEEVQDVRDSGLRGHPDSAVLAFAQTEGLTLITSDLGFGGAIRALPSFPGLILVRLPDEWPTSEVNQAIGMALNRLKGQDLFNSVTVVESDRIRFRPGKPPS